MTQMVAGEMPDEMVSQKNILDLINRGAACNVSDMTAQSIPTRSGIYFFFFFQT